MLLRALPPVGLKCTFRHEKSLLLIESSALRQTKSINDCEHSGQTRQAGGKLRGGVDPPHITVRDALLHGEEGLSGLRHSDARADWYRDWNYRSLSFHGDEYASGCNRCGPKVSSDSGSLGVGNILGWDALLLVWL